MKVHLTPEGPRPCSAKLGQCPYGEHFPSEEAGWQAFEEKMNKEHDLRGKRQRKSSLLVNSLVGGKIDLEAVEEVGGLLEDELAERLGHSVTEETDYSKLITVVSQLLQEEDSGLKSSSTFYGPYAKELSRALSPLPQDALALVREAIYTKTVNVNNRSADGDHIGQAVVEEPLVDHSSTGSLPPGKKGDLVVDAYAMDLKEMNGFSVKELITEPGELGDGTLLPVSSIYDPRQEIAIGLLRKGLTDANFRIKPGKASEVEKEFPELAQRARELVETRSYWLGEPPKGAKNSTFHKVAARAEILTKSGPLSVEKPLYEMGQKTVKTGPHTIRTKRYGGPEERASILLHEYAHAVQSETVIPGEKELLNSLVFIQPKATEEDYTYHTGLGDAYMGEEHGRELFTRATEGLFAPHANQNYLYSSDEIPTRIRRWALGAWAILAAEARRRASARTKP